ncbi:MAG: sensor domain-containing diguanylate cyclase [Planctomycetes bacterium]|nr:sensor domain-containing diguanylate cyclase [Planctomycetota bacterium]
MNAESRDGCDSTNSGVVTLRRNMSLHALASVSRLLATLDFEEILESIVSAAIELLGASRGFLFLIDDAGTFEMRVGRNSAGESIESGGETSISMSLVRQAVKERKCVYVRGGGDLPLDADSSMMRLGIGAALCLPMTVTELKSGREGRANRRRNWTRTRDVIGVIYIDRPDPGKPLSAEDYALYAAMGNLAAAALVNAAIYQDAISDGLTGLADRRHFQRTLAFETERARREAHPLALLMLDLDFFKQVNDTHGHLVGDDVLRKTGQLLRAHTRPSDLVARYGGEEFAVILTDCSLQHSLRVAEELRAALKAAFAGGPPGPMTMSIGVSAFEPFRDPSPEDVVKRADEALYASKRGGRDRVTAWSPELSADGSRADALRGLFSGEPSRDYRVMNLLMQVIFEFGAGGSPIARLERTLERIREFVSARRIAVYRPDGTRVAMICHASEEGWSQAGTADEPAPSVMAMPREEADGWSRGLSRGGKDLGVMVVTGQESEKGPGAPEAAILDALAVQVALLVEEIPECERTASFREDGWA